MMFLGCWPSCSGFLAKASHGFFARRRPGLSLRRHTASNVASLQRTDEAAKKVEEILKNTPGVGYYSSVIGYNMLSQASTTYNAFFFISLKKWDERTKPEEQYEAIKRILNQEMAKIPDAIGFAFPPRPFPESARPWRDHGAGG